MGRLSKFTLVGLIMILSVIMFTGCANKAVNVATLKGPTGMGMVKMMEDKDEMEIMNSLYPVHRMNW